MSVRWFFTFLILIFAPVLITTPVYSQSGPHIDDPVKREEHHMVFALVPHESSTHRAILSGNWTNPQIWSNQQVPSDRADVLIESGVLVTMDDTTSTRLHVE